MCAVKNEFQRNGLLNKDLLTMAVALTLAAPTQAQQSPEFSMEEIVVTAQKRSQSLQDVPISVNAVSEDALNKAGVQTVADVKKLVPALNIYSGPSPAMTSVSVRGAGTGASDPTLEPSVGIFIDGAFMPRSVFGLSDLVDISGVEVLLGPQGTLYGKNTNAGVVSVSTKGMPDDLEFNAEAGFGDDGLQEHKLSVGGQLSESTGYRFAAMTRRRDGLLEDEITGADDYSQVDTQAYRGQIFWQPNNELSARGIAYYSLSDSNSSEGEISFNPNSAYYGYVSAFEAVNNPGHVIGTDSEDRKISLTEATGGRLEVQGASVQIDYDFDQFTLTSISTYQEWEQSGYYSDTDKTPLDILSSNDRMDEQSLSQEIRLTSPGGETIDWIAGLFYFKSQLHRGSATEKYSNWGIGLPGVDSPASLAGIAENLAEAGDYAIWENKYQTESVAVFGQATWNISDATSLTLGLRYGEEDKKFSLFNSAYDANDVQFNFANWFSGAYTGGSFMPLTTGSLTEDPTDFTNYGPTIRDGDRSESDVTGSISLNHFIGDTMLYATVANGSKSGGFNGTFGALSTDRREFDTEETINYEIGAKIDGLFDGRARINLAYFYTEFSDFQAAAYDPVSTSFLVVNAGKQITQGVDLDAMLLVTENLTATAKLEYLDARYRDFDGANCHELSGGTGCDLSDSRLPHAANWAGSFTLDYVLPLNNADEIYAHAGLSFKTKHNASTSNAPYANTRYELFDARVGWRNENWDISLWGTNLTDDTYTQSTYGNTVSNLFNGTDNNASSLNYNSHLNPPRSYGLTLRYSYY